MTQSPAEAGERLSESQRISMTLLDGWPVPSARLFDWEPVIPPFWKLYPGKPQPCRFEEEIAQAFFQILTNRLP